MATHEIIAYNLWAVTEEIHKAMNFEMLKYVFQKSEQVSDRHCRKLLFLIEKNHFLLFFRQGLDFKENLDLSTLLGHEESSMWRGEGGKKTSVNENIYWKNGIWKKKENPRKGHPKK